MVEFLFLLRSMFVGFDSYYFENIFWAIYGLDTLNVPQEEMVKLLGKRGGSLGEKLPIGGMEYPVT